MGGQGSLEPLGTCDSDCGLLLLLLDCNLLNVIEALLFSVCQCCWR
uniref:Uncharacterized protein n=1 Tax=Rhizophora mucronata TaxID=61149 RepID=A0A2P2QQ12_RHIMU